MPLPHRGHQQSRDIQSAKAWAWAAIWGTITRIALASQLQGVVAACARGHHRNDIPELEHAAAANESTNTCALFNGGPGTGRPPGGTPGRRLVARSSDRDAAFPRRPCPCPVRSAAGSAALNMAMSIGCTGVPTSGSRWVPQRRAHGEAPRWWHPLAQSRQDRKMHVPEADDRVPTPGTEPPCPVQETRSPGCPPGPAPRGLRQGLLNIAGHADGEGLAVWCGTPSHQ